MKKFFDDNPVSVFLALLIVYSMPAYYVLQIAFSMLADGNDPVFVFFALGVMAVIAAILMIPFTPVLGVLIIAFEIIGWVGKTIFFAIRKRYRRRHNPV